jgi:hypothetical protein
VGKNYEAVQSRPEDTVMHHAQKSAMLGVASVALGADYLVTAASHPQVAAYEAVLSIPLNASIRAARLASDEGASAGEAIGTGLATTGAGVVMTMTLPLRTLGKAAMLGTNTGEFAYHIASGRRSQ